MSDPKGTISRRGALASIAGASLLATYARSGARQPHAASAGKLSLWRTRISSCFYDRKQHPIFDADLGTFDVNVDDSKSSMVSYRLRVARFPAKRKSPGVPVFYLFGGPAPGCDLYYYLDAGWGQKAFEDLVHTVTDNADLVVVDHRGGYGCFYPKLTPIPITEPMPFERCIDLEEREDFYRRYFGKQIEYWEAAGIDLRTIQTSSLVDDLDALRAALGYSKIRLCGDSNGTYRIREYLRKFPNRVEFALLFISHGYQKLPAPRHVRAALKRIDEAVADDPVAGRYVPSLSTLLDELTRRLSIHPATANVERENGVSTIQLDANDLAIYFWSLFSSNASILKAPALLWHMYRHNDYSKMATVAAKARLLGANGADSYTAAYAGSSMPSQEEVAANQREAGDAIYLNRQSEGGESSCAWPLPRDNHAPFRHQVPISYVQGGWDIRCPIEAVEAIGDAANLAVVPRMGHDTHIDYGDGKFWEQEALTKWLEGDAVPTPPSFDRAFDASAFQSGEEK